MESYGVNSNGTANTAEVEYVLIIAPPILRVRDAKDVYLVIQNMQYLDLMVSSGAFHFYKTDLRVASSIKQPPPAVCRLSLIRCVYGRRIL